MAHGFSATRGDRLPAYAERFAAAGLAVLLFDYRHFGDSGGEPRQLLHIGRQLEDYRAAIAFAKGLDGIDPTGSRCSAPRSRAATSSRSPPRTPRSPPSSRRLRSPTGWPPSPPSARATR